MQSKATSVRLALRLFGQKRKMPVVTGIFLTFYVTKNATRMVI
ncbi:hypothetical protein C7967_101908 [Thalassospira sp. 11-3]|nr:hypothetical protein C7967_101908 [Thalassospira sp. 11-3]